MVESVKKKITSRFIDEDFQTPVEHCENPKDVELLVSQEMVKVINKMYSFAEQQSFIEKLQSYRTNLMTQKPSDRALLGKTLSPDGITYLLAILAKCIQDNSGYIQARQERRAARANPGQFPAQSTNGQDVATSNLEFAVAKSPAGATKFTFAGGQGSRRGSNAGQSEYEYYEESEEYDSNNNSPRQSHRGGAQRSPRSGIKQPDQASALINMQNQRADLERQQRFQLYLDSLTELFELLQMDVFLLEHFKTSPSLLKHFFLTQLILSEKPDERNLGTKLSLLLYRFDANTVLSDISSDVHAIELLEKENINQLWKMLAAKRLTTEQFQDQGVPQNQKSRLSSLQTNYLTGGLNQSPSITSPRNSGLRAQSKLTQQSNNQSLNALQEGLSQPQQDSSQALHLMRDVIQDHDQQIDATRTEIEKLKLSEQRMQLSIDEMSQKFNFIRAKMETKLFSSLPDANQKVNNSVIEPQSPAQSPKIRAQEMLSPKSHSVGVESHIEMLKRVQKLELATNRILTDQGKMGEGYQLPVPTASEDAISIAQKKQIDQLLQRLDEMENLQVEQQALMADRKQEFSQIEAMMIMKHNNEGQQDMQSEIRVTPTQITQKEVSVPHNIESSMADSVDQMLSPQNPMNLLTSQQQQQNNPMMIKDSLFQKEILTRVQQLEERNMESILQLERMYQKLNEAEMKATKGVPTGPAQEAYEAIQTALKRIESLEKSDLSSRIAMKGPDEIFAMNETQKQIDNLVNRANDMQKRMEDVENLTGSIMQSNDERNTVELKGQMNDLKSKFSFLDPASDDQQSKTLASQIALLEEKYSQMSQKMIAHESTQNKKEVDRDIDERLQSMTIRIHQTEDLLTSINQKVSQGDKVSTSLPEGMDVQSQVKIQMMEHRLNSIQQKIDGLNPVFLLTMETRLEDFHSDLGELRNLYSSPSSSLNLVLDGLLKKVKDLEAGGNNRQRSPHKNQGMRNDDGGYRQLAANSRMNANANLGGSSALKSAGLMQMGSHRGSLN